jgi:hypothetical protein
MIDIGAGVICAMENKFKSRQGVDQLNRYDSEIEALRTSFHLAGKTYKTFLSFSGERPLGNWIALDYADLLAALADIDHTTEGYVADYKRLLKNLVECRDIFLRQHQQYPLVFKRSGMSTMDRITTPSQEGADEVEEFIFSNRLERLFVERLYRAVLEQAHVSSATVTESRGTALLQIHLFNVSWPEAPYGFEAGLQIQGNTLKYNLMANQAMYPKSHVRDLSEKYATSFDQAFKDRKFKVNPSRSRAYRSWSKRIADGDQIGAQSIADFSAWLAAEIKSASALWIEIFHLANRDGMPVNFAPFEGRIELDGLSGADKKALGKRHPK